MNKLLSKIIRNLKKPQKVPYKIFERILNLIYFFRFTLNYKQYYYENEQNIKFNNHNLDRKSGLKKLDQLKNSYSFLNKPMSSEHQVLFSSLSLKKEIKSILEIGTFDATNTFLLSKLFPSAKITTIDLKDEDKKFKDTYNRNSDEKLKKFSDERNKLLKVSDNILFLQENSVNLTFSNQKFDLIWIDGAHGYPVVTIDIVNSLRLCSEEGLIICDDVYENKVNNADDMYSSHASYETLSVLKQSGIINFDLFYKRLTKIENAIPKKRKFLGLIKKI